MSNKRYSVIYADPPWDYKGQTQHRKNGKPSGGAITHYPTMKLDELKKLDVQSLADDDCLLFMWATSPHLNQAIELMSAWGFKYATIAFIWDKMKTNPGFYTLSEFEICIVGKKGKIPKPRGLRNVRQRIVEKRTAHSAKPAEARNRIDLMFPTQQKIELFARSIPPGWDAWGNQINSTIQVGTLP